MSTELIVLLVIAGILIFLAGRAVSSGKLRGHNYGHYRSYRGDGYWHYWWYRGRRYRTWHWK